MLYFLSYVSKTRFWPCLYLFKNHSCLLLPPWGPHLGAWLHMPENTHSGTYWRMATAHFCSYRVSLPFLTTANCSVGHCLDKVFSSFFCFWDPHFFAFCQFLLCVRLGIPSARSPLCSVLSHLRVARYTLGGISYRPCVHSYTKALGPLHCCDFLCAHIARQSVFHHNNASLCCPHHPHWTVGTRLAQGGDLNSVHQIEEKVDRSIVGNGVYRTTGARRAKISLEYGQRDDQANQKDPEKRKK